MAGCRGLISLALLCLWLCHDSLAQNDMPCQNFQWNNAFSTFLNRHVNPDTPASMDQNVWERFIRQFGCNRRTQSFLEPRDLERIKAVCSNQGGKQFKENLCISRKTFSYITVRSEIGTCRICRIQRETKHLILACDLVNNQCLPVHFEGNQKNVKPDNNARGCQGGQKDAAAGTRTMHFYLSFRQGRIF